MVQWQWNVHPTNRLSFIRHLVHLPDIFSQSDISDDTTKTSIVFNLLIFRILNTNRQVSVFPETCLRHPFSASVLIRQLVFSPDHSSRTIRPLVREHILISQPHLHLPRLTHPTLLTLLGHPPPSATPGQKLKHNGWNKRDRKVKNEVKEYPDPWGRVTNTPRTSPLPNARPGKRWKTKKSENPRRKNSSLKIRTLKYEQEKTNRKFPSEKTDTKFDPKKRPKKTSEIQFNNKKQAKNIQL